MRKLEEASEDVVKIFEEVLDGTTIPQWVEFKVLCNNKQKNEVCKLNKANEVIEVLTDGIAFIITINESIFDMLPDDLQRMEIDKCLAGVEVSETDTLSKSKPDFFAHSGVIKKYGYDKLVVLKESIESLYIKQKEDEDALKAMTKGKRGRKPKQ